MDSDAELSLQIIELKFNKSDDNSVRDRLLLIRGIGIELDPDPDTDADADTEWEFEFNCSNSFGN